MKLSKKLAKRACLSLWFWVIRNFGKFTEMPFTFIKDGYNGRYADITRECINKCPLCEYNENTDRELGVSVCVLCPLKTCASGSLYGNIKTAFFKGEIWRARALSFILCFKVLFW